MSAKRLLLSTSAAALVALTLLGCNETQPVVAGAEASITVQDGDDQVGPAGQPLPTPLAVIVRDAAGIPVPNAPVVWTAVGGGSVSSATSLTNPEGIASVTRTLGTAAGEQSTLAGVGSLQPVEFAAVSQIQGATQIATAVTGTLSDTVLSTHTLVARVTDQHGTPIAGVLVGWTASGGGSISAASVATNSSGESIVQYTAGTLIGDQYGATATVSGLVGSPVSYSLNATAGNPVLIAKNAGDGLVVAAGATVPHSVIARDAHDNPANAVNVQWTAASGGGTVTPDLSLTDAEGAATATRTLGATAGFQTTTATAPGIAGAPSLTFTTNAAATVQVSNSIFTPNTATVPVGGVVIWAWQGTTYNHNVTFTPAAGAPADEPNRTTGSIQRTFTTAGTYNFACSRHSAMTGTITVVP